MRGHKRRKQPFRDEFRYRRRVASVGLAVALKSFSVAREKNRPHCRFSCRVNN